MHHWFQKCEMTKHQIDHFVANVNPDGLTHKIYVYAEGKMVSGLPILYISSLALLL